MRRLLDFLISRQNRLRTSLADAHPARDELIRKAFRSQEGRDWAAAEACYAQILELDPNDFEALYLLGQIRQEQGRTAEAIALTASAISQRPDIPQFHYTQAQLHSSAGDLPSACAAYRQAIALEPRFAQAHNDLGTLLERLEQPEDAATHYRHAIAAAPNLPQPYFNLGRLLANHGSLADARPLLEQSLRLAPEHLESLTRLADIDLAEARAVEAEARFRHVLGADENNAAACNGLAAALILQWRTAEALPFLERAIRLNPGEMAHFVNLGNLHMNAGHVDEALAAFDQAVALAPESAEAHYCRSFCRLLLGQFAAGWQDYEWRKRQQGDRSLGIRSFPQPEWHGEDIAGKTILLHAEQGFGDTLQFCRYAPMVAERGARVILAVPPGLKALCTTLAGVESVVADDQPFPAFDCHCPLLSLPGIFGTDLGNIPADIPYLHVDNARRQSWQQRLAEAGCADRLRIGIVWAAGPNRKFAYKSCPLATLAPLWLARPDADYFSLQLGPAASDLARVNAPVIDLTAAIEDFSDTAALVSCLDLVISVDTAVAHLAGALGKPAWVLLPSTPDFRWLRGRNDSPWYSSLRLFRQSQPGDWQTLIAEMARELSAYRPPTEAAR